MAVGDEKLPAPPDRAAAQRRRDERLAAALRANLAKRKEQGRARARHCNEATVADRRGSGSSVVAPAKPEPPGAPEPSPHDSAEIIAEKSAG